MKGADLKIWRKLNGWTQTDLMKELEIGSRQTIIKWEGSDKIPRLVELAIKAINELPDCRKDNVNDNRLSSKQEAYNRKIAEQITKAENIGNLRP